METEIEKVLPVTEKEDGNVAVDARMLFTYLESKQDFSTWIKGRISKCDLIENEDYVSLHKIVEREKGAVTRIEYALSLDAAKEISMMEGNDKTSQKVFYCL